MIEAVKHRFLAIRVRHSLADCARVKQETVKSHRVATLTRTVDDTLNSNGAEV